MSKPHKHAAVIKAWADGAQIQFQNSMGWADLETPEWYENVVYRVKPDPFAEFKAALAAGERVDMRCEGLAPGVGWVELLPGDYDWLGDYDWPRGCEYRVALPWQDERDAYDRGEKIEYKSLCTGEWGVTSHPVWTVGMGEYRVKPKTVSHECEAAALAIVAPGSVASYVTTPFKIPRIRLDIESTDGIVTNVTLKDWNA